MRHLAPLIENAYQLRVNSLASLPVGGKGIIRSLSCPRVLARRLLEMGLLPGTEVSVVRVAPFGDPMELRVREYSLSLRRSEAQLIEIETIPWK